MPNTAAVVNKNSEYRCGLPDCGALLFKGQIENASIEIRCKCGAVNTISVEARPQGQPEGRRNGKPYQERVVEQKK